MRTGTTADYLESWTIFQWASDLARGVPTRDQCDVPPPIISDLDIHIGDLDIPMYREIALRPDHAQSLARFLVCPLWVVDSIGQRNTC